MKTLDEVIDLMEGCGMIDWGADALHYLKEYRATQTAYIKAMADLEDNPPLTWDELKQMEGKPIWVEGQLHKHWCIIKRVFYDDLLGKNFISLMFCNHKGRNDSYQRKESNIGKTWQAYRKERE